MSDYLTVEDVADTPDEPDPQAPARVVDASVLLGLAAQLDAMRSQIDAALIVIDTVLIPGDARPVDVASFDMTGEIDEPCRHPSNRRQSLKTLNATDIRPHWTCRDCGHEHKPGD